MTREDLRELANFQADNEKNECALSLLAELDKGLWEDVASVSNDEIRTRAASILSGWAS